MPYGYHFCRAPRRAPDGTATLAKSNMAVIRVRIKH